MWTVEPRKRTTVPAAKIAGACLPYDVSVHWTLVQEQEPRVCVEKVLCHAQLNNPHSIVSREWTSYFIHVALNKLMTLCSFYWIRHLDQRWQNTCSFLQLCQLSDTVRFHSATGQYCLSLLAQWSFSVCVSDHIMITHSVQCRRLSVIAAFAAKVLHLLGTYHWSYLKPLTDVP